MVKSHSRGTHFRIECLEKRIAPAALTFINPQTASFIDADGSRAYVAVTQGTLTAVNFVLAPAGLGFQLETLDLSKTDFKSEFEDATVNIYAHPVSGTGDGTVDVGWINATGIDLLGVRVHGDLGRISAGDTDAHTAAVQNINVLSMGELGTSNQAPGGDLVSNLFGGVREWTIFGNFVGATVVATDNVSLNAHLSYIGHMDIGGSVIGGSASGSGEISADGGFKTLHIAGDLVGGTGFDSGSIQTIRSILDLNIAGSVRGNSGDFSGSIDTANINHAQIGGNVVGGSGENSGSIVGSGSTLLIFGGEIMVHGSLVGGSGDNSGFLQAVNPVQITVGGNLTGGGGFESGSILAHRAVSISVGSSVMGGGGMLSGSIIAQQNLGNAIIHGNVIGGTGQYSGAIRSLGNHMGHVTISGNLMGSSNAGADYSGSVTCDNGGILTVSIGGSQIGGAATASGTIQAGSVTGPASIDDVSIGGNLTAGSGAASGSVLSSETILSIYVRGDVNGDTSTGVQFTGSPTSALTSVLIHGDIETPLAINFPVTTMRVRGSIVADDIGDQGAIVGTVIDRLQINGGILGVTDNPVDILVTGKAGSAADAITTLKVFSSVANANILAGYAPVTPGTVAPYQVVNSSARIGAVGVDGDWTASNLVAGVSAGTDGLFGTADDTTANTSSIVSSIGRLTIYGEAIGSTDNSQHFGIVAQEVGAVTVADFPFLLTPGPGNDTNVADPKLNIGSTGNFTIHEVS